MNDSLRMPNFFAKEEDQGDTGLHHLSIEFTGSGSEYFRIWIVNILLVLVTCGIYFPWAKVRRLKYFYGNTLVDGEPLGFHGLPIKLLQGHVLVGVLFVLYSWAGQFSTTAGVVAFVAVMALWPALLNSSMRFRLRNTSWRGLRFDFKGTLKDAYRAVLPMFAPGLIFVGALAAVPDPKKAPDWFGLTVALVSLVSMALLPWMVYRLKKYQHDHYVFGPLQTTFAGTAGSMFKLFLKSFAATLVTTIVGGVLMAALAAAMGTAVTATGVTTVPNAMFTQVGMMLAIASFFTLVLVISRTYLTSRMQNLVWSNTCNTDLAFRSELKFRSLFSLTLKNWVLMILTLGLYWPFAAINMARMRLQAVKVITARDPKELVSAQTLHQGDAAGDAAADLLGVDIGL